MGGPGDALFPGASFLTRIVSYADRHGRRPSAVYEDYLEHPKDYRLLFAFEAYRAKEEKRQADAAK